MKNANVVSLLMRAIGWPLKRDGQFSVVPFVKISQPLDNVGGFSKRRSPGIVGILYKTSLVYVGRLLRNTHSIMLGGWQDSRSFTFFKQNNPVI